MFLDRIDIANRQLVVGGWRSVIPPFSLGFQVNWTIEPSLPGAHFGRLDTSFVSQLRPKQPLLLYCELWPTSFELLCYVSYHLAKPYPCTQFFHFDPWPVVEERPRTHQPPQVPLLTSLWPPSSLPLWHLLTVREEWGKGWNETSRKVTKIGWRWKCEKRTRKFSNWQVRRYNIPLKPTIDPIGRKSEDTGQNTHGTSMDMECIFQKKVRAKGDDSSSKKSYPIYIVGLYLNRFKAGFLSLKSMRFVILPWGSSSKNTLDLNSIWTSSRWYDPCNGGIWC